MGQSKQLEQNEILQNEQKVVNNPNRPEANQLAIYKSGLGIWTRGEKQIQVVVRAELEPGTYLTRSPLGHAASMLEFYGIRLLIATRT